MVTHEPPTATVIYAVWLIAVLVAFVGTQCRDTGDLLK